MEVLCIPELVDFIVLSGARDLAGTAVILCKLRQLCRLLQARYRTKVAATCVLSTNCGFGEYHFTAAAGLFELKTAPTREFRRYKHARAASITVAGEPVRGHHGEFVVVWEYPRAHKIAVPRRDFAALVGLFGVFDGVYFYADSDYYTITGIEILLLSLCHVKKPYRDTSRVLHYKGGKLYYIGATAMCKKNRTLAQLNCAAAQNR